MKRELLYNDEDHSYNLDGIDVPSVTTVINNVIDPFGLLRIPRQRLDYGRRKGRAAHRLVARWNRGERFDPESTHPRWMAYIDQWAVVSEMLGLKPVLVEQAIASRLYRYAGTLDLLARTRAGHLTLIDLKTGEPRPKLDIVQIAAYDWALKESLDIRPERYLSIYLHETNEETYTVERQIRRHGPWDVCNAFQVFVSGLTVAHYRRRSGIREDMPNE